MPPAPLLLRWTRFRSDPFGTGPEKRSAQVRDLAAAAGFELSDMTPPREFSRTAARAAGLAARWRFGATASVDRAGPGLLGFRSLFYRDALRAHAGAKVLLWETTYDDLLPLAARAAGYRVLALPHNLESLVSDAVFADPAYDPAADLSAEVRRLGRADALFTISREERWLLEARGLQPNYLPFFPSGALANQCAEIRRTRIARADPRGATTGPLLLMGSAVNPATARGIGQQLDWLADAPAVANGIVVAGSATDRLFGDRARPGLEVLGPVTPERLRELLTRCSALLVHTRGGAGAVTRIPEALAAGVPVISNPNGARDQAGTSGVHVYEDAKGFRELATARLPLPPEPTGHEIHAARFAATLRQLAAPFPDA